MKAAFALSALMGAIASAMPTPSNTVSSTLSSTSGVTDMVHSVLTVTNLDKTENLLIELEPSFAKQLTGLNLGSATKSVGTVVKTASTLAGLSSSNAGSNLITITLTSGEFALVSLTSEVESLLSGLLSGLGLGEVSSVVGTAVSTVEGTVINAASNAKRAEASNVVTIVDQSGKNLVVEAEGLLSDVDLSFITGTIGSVVAEVPVVGDLASKASALGLNTNKLFGVKSASGSFLLVTVESAASSVTGLVTSLLTGLGLGDLTTTVGTVVSTVESVAKRTEATNVLSIVGQNGKNLVVEAEGLLSDVDLRFITGTVGSVVAEVPVVGDLASKASALGLKTGNLFGVKSASGSFLLVTVESAASTVTGLVTSLLTGLGLGDLTTTVGTVVSTVEGVASQ